MAEAATVSAPDEKVTYPLQVDYCELCSMPPEVRRGGGMAKDLYLYYSDVFMQYCEYGPDPAKCYEWMKTNLPAQYARLVEGGELIFM